MSGSPSKEKAKHEQPELMAFLEDWTQKQHAFFESQFNRLEEKLSSMQAELAGLTCEFKGMKTNISGLEKKVEKNARQASLFCDRIDLVEAKMADLEDRSRRANIRVVGLSEGSEGSDAVAFLKRSLTSWFPVLDKNIEIMRAHRTYSGKNANLPDRPRVLIFSLLRYTDRQSILQAARKKPLVVDGKEVRFFADYSKYTAQRRKKFAHLIGRARSSGIQTFLIYPAKLRLIHESKAHLFETPEAAAEFLDSLNPGNLQKDGT